MHIFVVMVLDSKIPFLVNVIEVWQHDDAVEAVTDDEGSDVEEYSTGDDDDPGSSGISVILIPTKYSFESPTSLCLHTCSPKVPQLQSPSRNPRQQHTSCQWPPSWQQNIFMFWPAITFPTVFCLVLWDVLGWPRWVHDTILAVQHVIMRA